MDDRVKYDRSKSNSVCIRRRGNRLSHAVAQGGNFSIGANLFSPTPFPLAPALNIGLSALPHRTSNLYTNSFPCCVFSRLVRQNKQLQNPIAIVTGKGKFRPFDSKTAERILTSRYTICTSQTRYRNFRLYNRERNLESAPIQLA